MAKYNQKILVTYLRDVCSIELLLRHLYNQKEQVQETLDGYTWEANRKYKEPQPPIEVPVWGGFFSWIFLLLAVTLLFGVIFNSDLRSEGIGVTIIIILSALLVGGMGAYGVCMGMAEQRDQNSRALEKYEHQMEEYKRCCSRREYSSTQIRSTMGELTAVKNRINKLNKLREEVYSVNIIPGQYRNVQVACYLFDYFSTSQETDVDRILQTMLLDEICRKMDAILDRMDNIILNQRHQIALQEHQNEIIARNHREQMAVIARMEQNQELQLQYNAMIEANTRTTAFFATMDYLQSTK